MEMSKIWKMANFYIEQFWKKIAAFIVALFVIEGIALLVTVNIHEVKELCSYEMYISAAGIQWIFIVIFATLCIFLHQSLHSVQNDGKYAVMGLPGKMDNGMAGYFSNILAAFCVIAVFYCAQFLVLAIWEKPVMLFSAQREMKALGYCHQQYKELFYAFNTVPFFQSVLIRNLKTGIYVGISILSMAVLVSHQTGKFLLQKIVYVWLSAMLLLLNFTIFDLHNIEGNNIFYLLWNDTIAKLCDAISIEESMLFLFVLLITGAVSFAVTLKRRRKMGI